MENSKVLILGNDRTSEMQPVVASVHEPTCSGALRRAADVPAAVQLAEDDNWFPDLVVVCQSWPDEYSESAVRRLFELFPLARWICCCGVWCESDGRNRSIWPIAVRTPARFAESRIRREFSVLRGEQPALPATASRDESFAFDYSDDVSAEGNASPVAVSSPDRELRRWIHDLLTHAGYRVVSEDEAPVAAVVWDVDPFTGETLDTLRIFHQAHQDVAIVVLMNFAHPEDVTRLQECGAEAVVAKLSPQTELLGQLGAALRKSGNAVRGQ